MLTMTKMACKKKVFFSVIYLNIFENWRKRRIEVKALVLYVAAPGLITSIVYGPPEHQQG